MASSDVFPRAIVEQPGDTIAIASGAQLQMPQRRTEQLYKKLALGMLVTDVGGALVAGLIAAKLARAGFRSFSPGFYLSLLIGIPTWATVFASFHLYDLSRLAPVEEFRRVLAAVGVGVAIVGLGFKAISSVVFDQRAAVSLDWVIWTYVVSLVLVVSLRRAWHKYMWRLRKKDVLAYRTVIIGANEEAARITDVLRSSRHGFRPLGLISTRPGEGAFDGLPILGTVDDLASLIPAAGIECAFIASSAVDPDSMKTVMSQLRRHEVDVRVSANLSEILASRLTVQPIGDLLSMSLRPARLSGRQAILKRVFDIVVSSLILLVTSPFLVLAVLAIRLTSKGPVIYRQPRIGRNGQIFTMYKLRTMVHGADLLVNDLRDQSQDKGPLFKIHDDPRITRVGRRLRKWSIDEIPQLFNVLKGDMSLVGPRPMPAVFGPEEYEDWHRARWEALPGVTGLWQVSGRSRLTFDECVRLDLFYIENWSITYDAFILLKTIPAVLFRKGAF